MSDDYQRTTAICTKHFVNQYREAPAIFKHDQTYFLITSGCTGWDPNAAEYAVADAVLGPWEPRGNPCVGPGAERTFSAQSTFVLPVAGRPGAYIFMAAQWNSADLSDSRYAWLPMVIQSRDLTIAWQDRWEMSVFDSLAVARTDGSRVLG